MSNQKPAPALTEAKRKMALHDWNLRLTFDEADAVRDAYPRLVEMLKRAALDENYEADDCLALLRELGEL